MHGDRHGGRSGIGQRAERSQRMINRLMMLQMLQIMQLLVVVVVVVVLLVVGWSLLRNHLFGAEHARLETAAVVVDVDGFDNDAVASRLI